MRALLLALRQPLARSERARRLAACALLRALRPPSQASCACQPAIAACARRGCLPGALHTSTPFTPRP
eukprot:1311068-Pleurochrysis_carterae.AAC.1